MLPELLTVLATGALVLLLSLGDRLGR